MDRVSYNANHIAVNSVAFRTMVWFAGHLGEELTSMDVAVKVGCPKEDVPTVLRPLVKLGLLERTRQGGRGGPWTWRAGAVLVGCVRR